MKGRKATARPLLPSDRELKCDFHIFFLLFFWLEQEVGGSLG